MSTTLDPITPGEILLTEFMEPWGISQTHLARELDVPLTRVREIMHGQGGITADTALRLGAYFGTTPEFWLNLQSRYALKGARRDRWPAAAPKIRPFQAAR